MNEAKINTIKFNDLDPNFKITFKEAISRFWQGYFEFSGRATRSEFLKAGIFCFLVSVAIGIIPFLFGTEQVLCRDSYWGESYSEARISDEPTLILGIVWTIITFWPSLALCVRRGHDYGVSGLQTILTLLIPVVNIIVFFELFFRDSNRRKNDYGDSEKYPDEPKKLVEKKTICEVKDSVCPHCGKKIRVSLIVETTDDNF